MLVLNFQIVGLDAKNALKRNAATGITNIKDILSATSDTSNPEATDSLEVFIFLYYICKLLPYICRLFHFI